MENKSKYINKRIVELHSIKINNIGLTEKAMSELSGIPQPTISYHIRKVGLKSWKPDPRIIAARKTDEIVYAEIVKEAGMKGELQKRLNNLSPTKLNASLTRLKKLGKIDSRIIGTRNTHSYENWYEIFEQIVAHSVYFNAARSNSLGEYLVKRMPDVITYAQQMFLLDKYGSFPIATKRCIAAYMRNHRQSQ